MAHLLLMNALLRVTFRRVLALLNCAWCYVVGMGCLEHQNEYTYSPVNRAFPFWGRCWRTWRPGVWGPKAENRHCQSFNPTPQNLDPGQRHQWPGLTDRIPGWLICHRVTFRSCCFQCVTQDLFSTGDPSSVPADRLHRPVDIQEYERRGEGWSYRCPRRWDGEGGGKPYWADGQRQLLHWTGENREQELSPPGRARIMRTCTWACCPTVFVHSRISVALGH